MMRKNNKSDCVSFLDVDHQIGSMTWNWRPVLASIFNIIPVVTQYLVSLKTSKVTYAYLLSSWPLPCTRTCTPKYRYQLSFRTWWSTVHPRLVCIDRSRWLSDHNIVLSPRTAIGESKKVELLSHHLYQQTHCHWLSWDCFCLPMLISSLFVSHQVVYPLFPTLGLTIPVNNDVGDAPIDLFDNSNTFIQQRGPSPHGVGHSCSSPSHFKASNT